MVTQHTAQIVTVTALIITIIRHLGQVYVLRNEKRTLSPIYP